MKIFLIAFIIFQSILLKAQENENLSPEKHCRVAEKMFSDNDCSGALTHINKAIISRADDWEAYELRAMIYECLGKLDKAISDYSILIFHDPSKAEYLFSRGELNYRNGHYQHAIDDLNKALALPVGETSKVYFSTAVGDSGISGISTIKTLQAEMHNYIGLSFLELNEADSATRHFTEAISDRENVNYFVNRALTFEKMGNYQAALKDYEKALTINEYDQVAQYNLVQLYGKLGDLEKQKALLDQMSAYSTIPEIYIFKGTNYLLTEQFVEAIEQYDSAILLNDQNEEYFLYRGQAYEKNKQYEEARSDYEKAIALKKNFSNAYFGLGNIYYKKNQLDTSLIFYDLAILYDPAYAKAYLNRGIVYFRKNEMDKACINIRNAKNYGLKEAEELFNLKCKDQ